MKWRGTPDIKSPLQLPSPAAQAPCNKIPPTIKTSATNAHNSIASFKKTADTTSDRNGVRYARKNIYRHAQSIHAEISINSAPDERTKTTVIISYK